MRILWLKTELLHPVDKGGKIRTYSTLRELRRAHHVTYLTLDDGRGPASVVEQASEYCQELVRVPHVPSRKFGPRFYAELMANLMSRVPYAVARYRSAGMRRELERLIATQAFDLIVCDFLAPDINVPREIGVPTVLFQHNVEAMIWKRHAEVQSGFGRKAFFRGQWRKMARYEREACRRYDHVIAVSDDDRDTIRKEYEIDNVDSVPTGVDTEFFRPSGSVPPKPKNIVFVGSMDWLPNEDAVTFFVDEIWSRIRHAEPDATFTIVGRSPGSVVTTLAAKHDDIEVTGRVDDVRPYLERASMAIVPLRIGGGTRLKIYEAMAMGIPTVSTTVGAEGLPVTDGDELFLADEPQMFAERVVELLRDPQSARTMGVRAQERVRKEFSWDTAARPFIEICERVAEHQSGTRSGQILNDNPALSR